MTHKPPHLVIAGGGVAAVEAVAALRALTGSHPRITLLGPDSGLPHRAASVAAPFGFGQREPLPYDAIQRLARFDHCRGRLARVEPEAKRVVTSAGEPLAYDKLLIAVGARAEPALEGATTFSGPDDVEAITRALATGSRFAFVLPSASTWALPLYELATMAAVDLRDRGVDPSITVITPEPAPLWVFGAEASAAVTELLAARGIALRTGAHAVSVRDGAVEHAGQDRVAADRVIALPRLKGPAVRGLPHTDDGFIPVDAHGRVAGCPDVFAAGDATTFPLKQGGLATQQADAAAEAIAADLGVLERPEPFRPVMRGLLLTGGAPLYLRASLTASGEPESRTFRRAAPVSAVSQRTLWWPPAKIAGRYLAPLLATARPSALVTAQLQDYAPGPVSDEREEALELAFLLADADAEAGDYGQALRALDAAAALTGGVLPGPWEQRRREWSAA
jgi:sulfide:quinone oxidoreductase